MTSEETKTVATNVLGLRDNPYLEHWNKAAEQAGQRTSLLGLRTILSPPNWIHLQWPERVFIKRRIPPSARLMGMLAACSAARLRGTRVLLTVHNVYSHANTNPRLERIMWQALGKLVTDVHLLSAAGAQETYHAHPGLRGTRTHIVPMGDYRSMIDPDAPTRERAREQLGLDERHRVVVSFGSGRRYKGYPELVGAFSGLRGENDRLIIAGKLHDAGLADELAAAGDERLILIDRFLSQAELDGVIRASDLVVLPYRRILNSASAMLGLAHERKVLLPATPTFEEIGGLVGPGWVHRFEGAVDHEAIVRAFAANPAAPPDLRWASWENVSAGIGRMLRS